MACFLHTHMGVDLEICRGTIADTKLQGVRWVVGDGWHRGRPSLAYSPRTSKCCRPWPEICDWSYSAKEGVGNEITEKKKAHSSSPGGADSTYLFYRVTNSRKCTYSSPMDVVVLLSLPVRLLLSLLYVDCWLSDSSLLCTDSAS